MSSEFLETFGVIFFSVMTLFFLVETVLSGKWNKMYFTSGLPIFVKRISVGPRYNNIPLSSRFEAQFQSDWTNSLVFREIAPNTYGFREKFFEFRIFKYSPLMHGVLFFDSVNNQVVVKGFANWFSVGLSVIWLGCAILIGVKYFPEAASFVLGFLAFYSIILGFIYLIQYSRFSNVATFAAQEWERKYTMNVGGA